MGEKLYFKHASMGLAILVLVVFQVFVAFNRPHLPYTPDPKRKDDDIKGGISNEEPATSPVNYKIVISWEILHRLCGAVLAACIYYKQSQCV